jgi:hypothetical protein
MLCIASDEITIKLSVLCAFSNSYAIGNGSSFGYVAWYKQSIETAKIKPLHLQQTGKVSG